ncbi:MAG: hypothetical protein WBG42_04965, partial [Cryomorphaceae bacterium]
QEEKINGSFIEFGQDGFFFKSDQVEKELSLTDLSAIEIKLKSFQISSIDGSHYSINLDDYAQVDDKKEMKGHFETYKNKL